jgi:hypothetical protein
VAIGFGFGGKMKDMFCYIATSAGHVNLGFPRGSTHPDPSCVLEGEGKAMCHIKFTSTAELERNYVRRISRRPSNELGAAAPTRGTGKSVFKSRRG